MYVEGRIQTRQWEGQDGQKRYTTELVANTIQNLERRPRDDTGELAAASCRRAARSTPAAAERDRPPSGSGPPEPRTYDDLPF